MAYPWQRANLTKPSVGDKVVHAHYEYDTCTTLFVELSLLFSVREYRCIPSQVAQRYFCKLPTTQHVPTSTCTPQNKRQTPSRPHATQSYF